MVVRHPLDMAVSLYHQGDNMDRARLAELTGVPARPRRPRPSLHDWLVEWTLEQATPGEQLDSLIGVLHHAEDAWRRRDQPQMVLVHYADLLADLDAQMRRLASRLGVEVCEDRWPELVRAATFEQMRARSGELIPDSRGVLKDAAAFFRQGRSGAGRAVLTEAELAAYEQRVADLVPPDLAAWLHH